MQEQQQQSAMNNQAPGIKALNQAEGIARWISRTLVVFTRKDFGERYFGASGFGKMVTYTILLVLSYNASQQLDTALLGVFFFVSFLACLWHQFVIWRRNRRGEPWHSFYSGTPYLMRLLPLDEFTIKRWVEPLLWMGLGMFLLKISPALGGWLVFSGTCLGTTAALTAARERSKILDMIDAQIEARQMRAVLIEQQPPAKTEGYMLPVSGMKLRQRERLFDGFTSLYERAKEQIAKIETGRCVKCGAWNVLAGADYCGSCGHPVAAVVTTTRGPATSPPQPFRPRPAA
jgi:hypothetical protein